MPPPSRRRARRRVWWCVLGALSLLVIYPGISYGKALAAPGQAGVDVRTVDWLRSIGAGSTVDAVENWWFIHNVPATGPPSPAALPTLTGRPAAEPAALPTARGVPALPGEGTWSALRGGALEVTFVRPDPAHASVVAAVARLAPRQVAFTLHPGTQDPAGAAARGAPRVTWAERRSLLATFNSGFLMVDCRGGWYAGGRQFGPLRAGAASLVIRRGGAATVGRWGADVGMGPDVAAVRQNLDLIVAGGRPVPGLAANAAGQFGNRRSQLQYTWRSGIGVDAAGNLVYVAGNQLTLATLATALAESGVLRGMELDMHGAMVSFNVYPVGAGHPVKLLPTMRSPATRYLDADQRDFFTVTVRPGVPARHALR